MSSRRAQLAQIAARLISERGYHAVGMDVIGEAAGISGPALYRHFESKQQMLGVILLEPVKRLNKAARAAVAGYRSPVGALEALIDFHTRFTGGGVDIPHIYYRCVDELEAGDRARLEEALDMYIEVWVEQILRVRPDIGRDVARSTVMALFRIFNLPRGERQKAADAHDDLMARLAKGALQGLLASPEVASGDRDRHPAEAV